MKFSIQELYAWYRQTIRNPKYRGWIIAGTLAYLVSPIDISPDVFPIVGQIDDVAIVTLLLAEISQMLIEQVRANRAAAQPGKEDGDNEAPKGEVVDVEAIDVDD